MQTKDLLILIKSLSKSEKRNFCLQAGKQGKEAHYLILYKELEKVAADWDPEKSDPVINETALEVKFRRNNVKGSFAVIKTYLAQSIFKSLRQLYEKNTRRDLIETHIKDASILENRGLLELAAESLREALNIAIKYEYHALAFDILVHLIRIETQIDFRSYGASIEKRLADIKKMMSYLECESHYYVLYYQTFLQFRLGFKKKKGDAFVSTPDENRTWPTPTFLSCMYNSQLLSLNALTSGDTLAAWKEGENLLQLWEQQPDFKTERVSQYIKQVSNYLNFCILGRAFEHYEHYLNELKKLKKGEPITLDIEAELEQNILLAEQLYYLNTDRLEEARALFSSIENALKKFGSKISKAREITLRYNNIVTLYALSDYDLALQQCSDMIQMRYYAHRHDLQMLVKILQIIIHYELRDHQYLNKLVQNLGRLFNQNEDSRDFERLVLKNLLKLAETQVRNLPPEKEQEINKQLFGQFYDELLSNKKESPPQFRIGSEEIIVWVRSKVEQEPFRVVLNRKWRE